MNLETKITIYKFTPQVFTLTPQFAHSFREVLIINDKRNTPVNYIAFHLVSFFHNYCLTG